MTNQKKGPALSRDIFHGLKNMEEHAAWMQHTIDDTWEAYDV